MTMMLSASIAASAAAGPDLVAGSPVYVALGDSWAYGEGASNPATGGYVARLAGYLRNGVDCLPAQSEAAADGCEHLQVLNLARPARDGLPGVTAQAVASEQLPIAVSILASRNGDVNPRNDVEALTVQVGGNDVFAPIQQACLAGFSPECQYTWVTEMATFEAELSPIVAQLRAAAGPDTPIVLGTYDNPVPYCWLGAAYGAPAVTLGAMVLEGTPDGSLDGIHDVVRRVAAQHDADVAEMFGRMGPGDFVGGDDCLHLTDSGHAKAATVFAEILES
ncbi:MAG: SGNH/GDSL hydrolase family protein [Actinomycetota bacterium]